MLLSFLSSPAVTRRWEPLIWKNEMIKGCALLRDGDQGLFTVFHVSKVIAWYLFQSSWIGVYLVYILKRWTKAPQVHSSYLQKSTNLYCMLAKNDEKWTFLHARERSNLARVQILHIDNISLRRSVISVHMLFPKMLLLQCNHNATQCSSKHPPFHQSIQEKESIWTSTLSMPKYSYHSMKHPNRHTPWST